MAELRKLIRLAKNAYAVTIPKKYLNALGLKFGDYMEVSLQSGKVLRIRKHPPIKKT